ncbi:uncharacterized protein IL334_000609 [Kwoniella shivajii]|uniref:Myb-like domain-containing protein n=1 Tax=Kwoniella shivajii TaxID=564305 RepID=A0ABZ1CPM0_9TREE|nr:hypothetical protein IL334_000609 [Kwoniella shivajii]
MPAKREHSSELDELDIKPQVNTSKKKPRATVTPKSESEQGTPSKSKSTPKKSKVDSPEKRMGPWSGEELKLLYSIMCPKKVGVSWNDVAGEIQGRDTKACQNKWSRMQGKIMQAIEDMGE